MFSFEYDEAGTQRGKFTMIGNVLLQNLLKIKKWFQITLWLAIDLIPGSTKL